MPQPYVSSVNRPWGARVGNGALESQPDIPSYRCRSSSSNWLCLRPICKCSSLCAGAGPTSYHLLGTLWMSLTAYSVRERRGELSMEVEAARRAKETR